MANGNSELRDELHRLTLPPEAVNLGWLELEGSRDGGTERANSSQRPSAHAVLAANLRGDSSAPIAEISHKRGMPFLFIAGYR
jgi:hypothetical protein